LQVEVFVHQIESIRDRLCRYVERDRPASLHQNINQLPLPRQNSLEQVFEEVATIVEELQLAQQELLQEQEELVAARQALEAQCQKYQELSDFVNNGAIGLHWVGADGCILWANQAELDLLGYCREEYIGHHITEFHADQDVINDILRRLTANETLHDYEARLLCKDGSIKHVLIDSNVYWKDGQFIHTRCFTRDVTQRKQIEQKLQENEERFRSLSACSPVGIFLTDIEGRCTYTNPRCQAICGFTLEQSLGEGWSESIHPEDREKVFADWSDTTREGREYSDEFRFQTKEGRVRWVHVRSSPMFGDRGELIGHVGTVEDITERKQVFEQLTQSENRWRTIVETEPECVKLVAADGTLLDINPAGVAMIEAPSANAVIGKSAYSFIVPEHREAFVALNESVCQGNRGILEFEIIGLQGTRRWMETHAVPLRSESDGTLVHLAITRDITARKRAEDALRLAKQELEIRVEERTAQLQVANEQLLSEVAERKRAEEELERSLSLLRATLEATADGIIVSQNGRHIATVNQKFVEMWGIPESAIASRELNQVVPLLLEQLQEPEKFLDQTQDLLAQLDAEAYGIYQLKDGRVFERYSRPQQIGENIVGRVCSFRDITLAQRSQEALRQSEARYRAIVEDQMELLCRYKPDGTLTFVNDAYCRYFNKKQEELIGRTFMPLIPDEEREEVKHYIASFNPENPINTIEHHVILPTGEIGWQQWSDRALFDEQGNLVEFQSVGWDITERKLAEEALKKAHDELEIRVQERTAQLKQTTARFQELARREALLNCLTSQIRNSLALDTILESAVQEIYNQLEIDVCVFAWYCPDGTSRGWQVVKEAKNPELSSFLGLYPLESWRPFTCKLLEQEDFQSDNITQSDWSMQQMLLPYGTVALLSLPIETQSGQLGTLTCGRLLSWQPWTDEELQLLQAVANQLVIGINQSQLYEQSRIAATTAQTKATQLEQALHELQQTQAQLIQSEKMSSLGQLVAGVAHEINNPLNFIHGNLIHVHQYTLDLLGLIQLYQEYYSYPAAEIQVQTEVIDLDFIKEDLPKVLSSMEMGADRIRNIVLSLRNFSRADQAERKWANIHEGIDNTLLILAHRLKSKQPGVPDIQVIKDYGNLPLVHCYVGQLNQVFMNILSNAIEAIDERNKHRSPEDLKNHPSTIWICTEVLAPCNQVVILIADNGLGMTQEVCSRLFDPFFTTKPVGSGTGLGMSISYKIVVEEHGGQLQCISAPDLGAAFLIYIPIQTVNERGLSKQVKR
jgi:PAS domain S-box-containing protein